MIFMPPAPYLEQYYSNLSAIQDFTGCQFDLAIDGDFNSQYQIAFLLKNSLENRWVKNNSDFDNQLRCDYNNITDDVLSGTDKTADNLVYLQRHVRFELQGCHFEAEAFHIRYMGAKINNLKSVCKYVKKKRNGILITIRPQNGKNIFEKCMLLSGIKSISLTTNSNSHN